MGKIVCPNCNSYIDETDEACPYCGQNFVITCAACGASISEDDEVCPHCGVSLIEVSKEDETGDCNNEETNPPHENADEADEEYETSNVSQKGIADIIFANVDRKIKIWSLIVFAVGILSSIASGIVLMYNEVTHVVVALLIIVFGSIGSYIGAMFIYAFGELIFRTKQAAINAKVTALSTTEANGHDYNYLLEQIEEEENQ